MLRGHAPRDQDGPRLSFDHLLRKQLILDIIVVVIFIIVVFIIVVFVIVVFIIVIVIFIIVFVVDLRCVRVVIAIDRAGVLRVEDWQFGAPGRVASPVSSLPVSS